MHPDADAAGTIASVCTRLAIIAVAMLAACGRIGFDTFGSIDGGRSDAMESTDSAPSNCVSDDDCDRCERCRGMRCETARFVELGAGFYNACARDELGDVWCWGLGEYGSLGIPTGSPGTLMYSRPRRIGLGGVVEIAVGRGIVLARLDSGALWGWGWALASGPGKSRRSTRFTRGRVLAPTCARPR